MEIPVCVVYKSSNKRILYAEVGKEFTDLLLKLLSLPLAYVAKLWKEHSSTEGISEIGSIGKLFESACNLEASLLLVKKNVIIDQEPPNPLPFLPAISLPPRQISYSYSCSKCHYETSRTHSCVYYKSSYSLCCERCAAFPYDSNIKLSFPGEAPPLHSGGYVKECSRFIVSDDLCIAPSSTTSCMELLKSLNVHDMSDISSMELKIGKQEVVEIVKASLTSLTVLNDVFKIDLSTA